MNKIYYSPKGYWKGLTALVPKRAFVKEELQIIPEGTYKHLY